MRFLLCYNNRVHWESMYSKVIVDISELEAHIFKWFISYAGVWFLQKKKFPKNSFLARKIFFIRAVFGKSSFLKKNFLRFYIEVSFSFSKFVYEI